MDFTNEHKEEREYAKKLPFGVNKVLILGFSLEKTKDGNEFIEVGFTNMDQDIEDKARVYFTEKAAGFSFDTLRQIFVHNAPEDKKDIARQSVNAVASTEKLVELLASKLPGKEMWVTKYLDPKRNYEKNGQTFKSINLNIYGYEPKLNESLMPKAQESVGNAAQATFGSQSDEPFPGKHAGGSKKADDWS